MKMNVKTSLKDKNYKVEKKKKNQKRYIFMHTVSVKMFNIFRSLTFKMFKIF